MDVFQDDLPIIYSEFHKIVLEQDDYFIEKIENIEQKLDEKIHGKTEFKIEDKEEYKTFKDKYNG